MTDEDRQTWMASEDGGEATLCFDRCNLCLNRGPLYFSQMRRLCKIVFAKCTKTKVTPMHTDWTVEPGTTLPVLLYSQSFSTQTIVLRQFSVSFIQDGQVELKIVPQLLIAGSGKQRATHFQTSIKENRDTFRSGVVIYSCFNPAPNRI